MKIGTYGPIPPEYGGSGTGGIHTILIALYSKLRVKQRQCILVSNWDFSRPEVSPKLSSIFGDVSTELPCQSKIQKIFVTIRHLHLLRPMETIGLILHSIFYLSSPLMYLYHVISIKRFLLKTEPDLLHVHMIDYHTSFALLAANGLPVVTTVQSFNVLKGESRFQNWKFKRIIAYNLKRMRYIISVSSFVTAELKEIFHYESSYYIPNSVDTEGFRPREQNRSGSQNIRLVFTGNLIRRKSVHILVKALKSVIVKHSEIKLDIIGEGPEREKLEELVSNLGISEAVNFLGKWPWEKLRAGYPDYDILIMPSTNEGLSLSMLEAMSCGLCVIAGRPSSGTYDALIDGVTGIYYEYGNVDALAEKLMLLIDNQPLRRTISNRAREEVVKHYDVGKNAIRLHEVFKGVLGSHEFETKEAIN